LSDNEFKDLQNFGKIIEKKPEKNTKVIVKEKKDFSKKFKPVFSILKKKVLVFGIKLIKITIATGEWIRKKIKTIVNRAKQRNAHRKKIKFAQKPKQKIQKSAYKIVETKKERRNKTIITRRRIPIDYNPLELQPKKTDLGALFYLTFKNDNAQEANPEAYTRLKNSVWDFPIQSKGRIRLFFSKRNNNK